MQGPTFSSPSRLESLQELAAAPRAVVVTDVEMKFNSMVIFMIKWALATIPAAFILGFISLIILMFFYLLVGLK